MNYGEILSKAWKIIWKYKVLWIFGILAGLGSGGGGGGGTSGRNINMPNGRTPNSDFNFYGERIASWVQTNWWVLVILALLVLIFIVVVVILGTYGRIGLARGAWQADDGAPRLTFSGLFAESGRYFMRVLLLSLLIFAVGVVLTVLIALPTALIAVFTLGFGLICLIPCFCLLGIAGWVVQIIIRMAIIAIVGEDLGTIDGLKRGWDVVHTHLAETIVMALILGIGGGIIGFVIALPFLAAAVPLVFLAFNQTATAVRGSLITAGVIFCLYLPVAIFLGGVLESYVGSAWTLTFRRLTGREAAGMEVLPAP